jgi:hypothetical protein
MRNAARFIGLVATVGMLSTVVACRGGDDDGDDDGVPDSAMPLPDAHLNGDGSVIDGDGSVIEQPDGGLSGEVTIYQVQDPAGTVSEGAQVTLKNVVITAIDTFGARVGGIYVQELDGGPFSGVFVFGAQFATAPVVGDIVTVSGGVKQEFICPVSSCPTQDTTGRKLTEIGPPQGGTVTLTKTGTGKLPTPPVVDPTLIVTNDVEAEKWEGVPITLANVAALSAPRAVSTSDGADATFQGMTVTGPIDVQSSMVHLAIGTTAFVKGDCFGSITGILDYFFDYHLQPRTEEDFVTAGTSCLPAENTAPLCTDGMDNDHNGFSDCQDLSCRGVAGVDCTVETSIGDIQSGTVPAQTQVALHNVVVTAVAKFHEAGSTTEEARIWVADSATAASRNGILVFKPTISGTNSATIDNLVPGDIVNVNGPTKENFDETQINGGTLERVGTGPAPTPLVVTLDMLATPASAEAFEGVLVTVQNQKVVSINPDGAMDFGEWSVGTATSTLRIDDIMFKKPVGLAVGDCFASVTGTLGFGFSNYKLEPRSAADVVTGTTCP